MPPRIEFLALVLVALLATGCGSEPKRPIQELTRAQTLIDQAQKAGAQRYAAADLEAARNKLQAANKAAEKNNREVAAQLATEAALDAEVAAARTTSGKAKQAAQELSKSTETAPQEATRKPEPGTSQP